MEEVLTVLVRNIQDKKGIQDREKQEEGRYAFWKSCLLQETWNGSWMERAQQEGYYEPERRVSLHLLRIFPGVEQKKGKDATLNHFIVRNVTEEFFGREETDGSLLAVVRRSDCEWFLVFAQGGMGEAVSDYRTCLEQALSMRICIYIGKECAEKDLEERRRFLSWNAFGKK